MISSLFVIPWSGREPQGLTRKTQAPPLLLHEFIGDADNAMVRLLSDSPQLGFVPIVLYGPAGCGKTHLSWLLAANTANTANTTNTAKTAADSTKQRGCWLSGAEFVKQVLAAIEADSVSDLRQRLRAAPALFLDGLERIATRASAQDELRWLLDDCAQRSVPVLVTSTVLPLEIPDLCPQIASRLHQGLIVPLAPPGATARQQLVRELLAKAGVDLPPRLASRLLQRLVPDSVLTNDGILKTDSLLKTGSLLTADSMRAANSMLASDGMRDSEGLLENEGENLPPSLMTLGGRRERRGTAALSPTVPALQEMVAELAKIHRVRPFTSGRGRMLDDAEPADLATHSLRCVDAFVEKWTQRAAVSLKQVSQAVAEYFGIRLVELKGPSRRQMVLRARGVAIYLGRHLTGESLDRLGAHFGGRDHSTALHAVRKTEELLAHDPTLRKAVDDLERRLRHDGES